MAQQTFYSDYLNIDESYFPQINDDSIKRGEKTNPDFWMKTYPHPAFIEILQKISMILDGGAGHSLWIYGAYGTGKSQCAYALRKILEVPNEDLEKYWDKFSTVLKNQNTLDLLTKIKGIKDTNNILVVYRYSSSEIENNRILFEKIQESIQKSLKKNGYSYFGENSLRKSVLLWLEDETNKDYFNKIIQKKYTSRFSEPTADEVIKKLSNEENDATDLIKNILDMGINEGIQAFRLTIDDLKEWIQDIIDKNNIKIVFVWDEFSEYFRQNRSGLTGFQKLVEMYDNNFFFIPVAHEFNSLFDTKNDEWKKIRNRFFDIDIKLPNDVAFELIANAFDIKDEAQDSWKIIFNDLNENVQKARTAVKKGKNVDNENCIRNLFPIHPYTAIALKFIADTFKSNQRSIFDYIKSPAGDTVKAFQWYIQNEGPYSSFPLLTMDYLWDFLEKEKNNLDSKIRTILDGYNRRVVKRGNNKFTQKEDAVLKTIIIMQALDTALDCQHEIFKATDKNLSNAFEGISNLEGSAAPNTAKSLLDEKLIHFDADSKAYIIESFDHDKSKIEETKVTIKNKLTTEKLIQDGQFDTLFSLTPSLKLRFEKEPGSGKIHVTGPSHFKKDLNDLSHSQIPDWKFKTLAVFAHDEQGADYIQKTIKELAENRNLDGVILIDATSVQMTAKQLDDYLTNAAKSDVYMENNHQVSRDFGDAAKRVLTDLWKSGIQGSKFIVYYQGKALDDCQNLENLKTRLQEIAQNKFPFAFEFIPNLTENQLKAGQTRASAQCGIEQKTAGIVGKIENNVFPQGIWKIEQYWKKSPNEKISIIKKKIDDLITKSFKHDGKISVRKICEELENQYGFACCNLYSFLVGFLLKEYAANPKLRYLGSGNPEEITSSNLADGIESYYKNRKDCYIVERTPEEETFYKVTEDAWEVKGDTPNKIATAITEILKEKGFPLRFIRDTVSDDLYNFAKLYIDMIGQKSDSQLAIVRKIGKIAQSNPTYASSLKDALTVDNFQSGAQIFLKKFDNGKLVNLAAEIGTEDLLADINKCFRIKHQCLWDESTQDETIRSLEQEYTFVYQTNSIIGCNNTSINNTYDHWREIVKWFPVSNEIIREKSPELCPLIQLLKTLVDGRTPLTENIIETNEILKNHEEKIKDIFKNKSEYFKTVYWAYICDLSEDEITDIQNNIQTGMFLKTKSDCYNTVNNAVKETLRKQKKNQLKNLWFEKTGTTDPKKWSEKFSMPVLCVVESNEFDDAKAAFEAMLSTSSTDASIEDAQDYFKKTKLFDHLKNEEYRNKCFREEFLYGGLDSIISVNDVIQKLENTATPPYEWYGNKGIREQIKELAQKEYNAGGSSKVVEIIDNMNGDDLKIFIKHLVNDNMTVGLEILSREKNL